MGRSYLPAIPPLNQAQDINIVAQAATSDLPGVKPWRCRAVVTCLAEMWVYLKQGMLNKICEKVKTLKIKHALKLFAEMRSDVHHFPGSSSKLT